jgi:ribosome-binding factor A
MQPVRHERVRELLKRTLGEIIRAELPVSEAGVLAVNDVEVAGDLQSATVYVGVVGSADQQRRAQTVLDTHARRLQQCLARAVVLRYTPRLKFQIDDSVQRGNRVLQIMEELEKQPPTRP